MAGGKKVTLVDEVLAIAALAQGKTQDETARIIKRPQATVQAIIAKDNNIEVIKAQAVEFKKGLLSVLGSQILRFQSFITDEKLEKSSAYQLAGMSALYAERYGDVLASLTQQTQQQQQHLTLVQVNDSKSELQAEMQRIRDDINNLKTQRKSSKFKKRDSDAIINDSSNYSK